MIVRLMLFGLITSLFVGLVYVVTKPVIIEAKEQARQEKLYLLAAPLLANGRIASPGSATTRQRANSKASSARTSR